MKVNTTRHVETTLERRHKVVSLPLEIHLSPSNIHQKSEAKDRRSTTKDFKLRTNVLEYQLSTQSLE